MTTPVSRSMTLQEMRERLAACRERCLSCKNNLNNGTCGALPVSQWRVPCGQYYLYAANIHYAGLHGDHTHPRVWFSNAALAPPCGAYERGGA